MSALAAVAVRRRGGPAWRLFLALAGTVLIATMTIANRGIVVSDEGLAYDLTWWSRNWDALPGLVGGDIGWWLNVALFVPAATGWTVLTGRPAVVSGVLVALVLAIETLHATVLSGAGDPTDVVANVLGIAIGVGLAMTTRNAQNPAPLPFR
ncbi:MAG: VanZ family protein [Ilumatobacteraceae bacterium]|nr:VanZ family protein [Ilumatobacteraceae bacterium]